MEIFTVWVVYIRFEQIMHLKDMKDYAVIMIIVMQKCLPSGYSLSLISSFDSKENEHNVYRGKDCIKRFCSDLKELATKITNYQEKEMIPLPDKENKFYEKQEKCHICQKEFCYDKNEKNKFKIYKKVKTNGKTITYKLKFIDSCRFVQSKLSDLVDKLSEISNKDCKTCMKRKKY